MTTEDGRTVLRFYISPSWDAHTYAHYRYAPDNWADMTEEEREIFLRDESILWMEESIEYGAAVHDPAAQNEKWSSGWESGGDPNEPEEVY